MKLAELRYRENYESSALHEVAHWCIAGKLRRQLEDFGYVYIPEGRTLDQQRKFCNFEIRPQALEWIFAEAAGVSFNLSLDDFSEQNKFLEEGFRQRVIDEKKLLKKIGLPSRAQLFLSKLKAAN